MAVFSPGPGVAAEQNGRATVTMAGFRARSDGGALLYVELTRPVEVQAAGGGRSLSFVMQDAKVILRNNKHPLLAQHFASIVLNAKLVPSERDVKLEVELREASSPTHRLVPQPGGGATLQVDFPAPSKKGEMDRAGGRR